MGGTGAGGEGVMAVSESQRNLIVARYRLGVRPGDIARELIGVDYHDVRRVLREAELTEQPDYVPSPMRIRIECAKIRNRWTPAEERSRRAIRPTPPVEVREAHEPWVNFGGEADWEW